MKEIQNILQKYWKYLFGVLIIYAIFLRLYKLGVPSFWIDEGFSSYSSVSGNVMSYYLHNLSQILSFQVFGISDWSARVPSVFFSVLTIPVVYYISQRLFSDTRISVIATLVFCFASIEIAWARQARFYTLLQFLVYFQIALGLSLVAKFRYWVFFSGCILLYISLYFHPFLYIGIPLFFGITGYCIYLKKGFPKMNFKNGVFGLFVTIGILGNYTHAKINTGEAVGLQVSQRISDEVAKIYMQMYSNHILYESGWLFIAFVIGLFVFAFKRDFVKTFILGVGFLGSFYIISQKGFLFHTRYVFFLFPLIYIGGIACIIYGYDKIRNIYLKNIFAVLVCVFIVFSGKYTFFPQANYELDFTSPQVDFKNAYLSIPDNAKIISGFPMLCEWYYNKRGDCEYSLAVDFVGNADVQKRIIERGQDNYTQLPHLQSIDQLKVGQDYYFVFDDISYKRHISQVLHENILEKGELYYNEGENFKNIKIFKLSL